MPKGQPVPVQPLMGPPLPVSATGAEKPRLSQPQTSHCPGPKGALGHTGSYPHPPGPPGLLGVQRHHLSSVVPAQAAGGPSPFPPPQPASPCTPGCSGVGVHVLEVTPESPGNLPPPKVRVPGRGPMAGVETQARPHLATPHHDFQNPAGGSVSEKLTSTPRPPRPPSTAARLRLAPLSMPLPVLLVPWCLLQQSCPCRKAGRGGQWGL